MLLAANYQHIHTFQFCPRRSARYQEDRTSWKLLATACFKVNDAL